MHWIDALLAFVSLLALCAAISGLAGVDSALAPLLAVSAVMLAFSLAGVVGGLVVMGWLFTAACFGLLALALWRRGPLAVLRSLRTPGFVMFAGLGLVLLVYFAIRQPVFSQWDEFSFWGTAVKLVKLNNELYTTTDASWYWTATQNPGLVMLGYFSQFFGAEFVPWKVYFGYDLLLVACVAAMMAPFARKEWPVWAPLAAAGLLTPFFFLVTTRVTQLAVPYISSYGDLPAGMMFGGVLAVYFSLRDGEERGRCAMNLWAPLLALGAFALIKANTLPVVLVAAGIMAADTLFFYHGSRIKAPEVDEDGVAHLEDAPRVGLPGPLAALLRAAAMLAVPVAAYAVWTLHAGWANAQNPATGGEATGMSVAGAVVNGFRQLLGVGERDAEFWQTAKNFAWVFFQGGEFNISMLGRAVFTCLLIGALLALAVVLAPAGRARRRVLLAAVLSCGGFAGYMLVLLFSYAYVFKQPGILDYARYMSSYCAGWLMLAMLLLALGARARVVLLPGEDASMFVRLKGPLAQGGLLALAAGMLALTAWRVPAGYSALDYPAGAFDDRRLEERVFTAAAGRVEEGARTFFVSQGDDGQMWFRCAYDFLPKILDYSGGGGTIAPPGLENIPYYIPMTLGELAGYLEENDCEYVFVESCDDLFYEAYAPLFSDGLARARTGPALYRRGGLRGYEPVA